MARGLLLLELGAVVLGLAGLARLASRWAFSPIPLYLLAGLAFGEGGIVPLVTAEEFIEVGAEIGLILLLLMLGLEYTAEDLTSNLRRGLPVGVVNLVLNATPGVVAGILLGWGPLAAALLGGVTYISSSGAVAKLLADLRWTGNRETPAVLSILVMEDLVMAVYLPIIAVLLSGEGTGRAIIAVGAAVLAVVLVLVFAVRHGHVLSRAVFSQSDEALLLTILGLALVVAGLAEQLQVSTAVGAFLVGIGLSGPAATRAHALLSPMRDLFGAVFFVLFGLRLDPADIPPVLGVAIALAAVGAATKLATGWWSGRSAGVGIPGRLRAGSLLVGRGEFSIAIATLGVTAGVEPRLGPLTAAYVLALGVAAPILARLADPVGAAMTGGPRGSAPAPAMRPEPPGGKIPRPRRRRGRE